jgi:hypothetical protein
MKESPILHRSLLALSDAGFLAFRNNTGMGWAGSPQRVSKPTPVTLMPGDVLIRSARPLHSGLCVGSADIIGIGPGGRFFGIETKSTTGRQSPEQKLFGAAVVTAGGIYGVARSEVDALAVVMDVVHRPKSSEWSI